MESEVLSEIRQARRRKKRFRRRLLVAVLALLLVGILTILTFQFLGKWGVHITLHGDRDVNVEVNSEYREEGAEASYGSGRFSFFERTECAVSIEGAVDVTKPGEYRIAYRAEYEGHVETVYRTVHVVDSKPPVITLVYDENIYTPIGHEFVEEGYTATDEYEGDVTDRVTREIPGDGFVYYSVTDSAGNTATCKREIRYDDRVAPVITLEGDAVVEVDLRKEYVEPGYTAADDCDGDVTGLVTVSTAPGSAENETVYTYSATDAHGNTGTATRTVVRKDLESPIITLEGDEHFTVLAGDAYHEPGYTGTDRQDGDLTELVVVEGEVVNYREGIYPITYTVTDSDGYVTTVTREVEVIAREQPEKVAPGQKIVYLTFDDGPCIYTEELLEILDRYGVKVTFFVTNQFPGYQSIIKKEYEAGHTVAVHTYSHNYKLVYASEDAYFADFNAMNDIIEEQTGHRSTQVRFPGGGSNAISRQYCKGIMTTLSQDMERLGFQYYDWNVSSGDVEDANTVSAVANRVINGIQRYNISIVLQHDIKQYSVRAVEQIIEWGLANGYTFLPLTPDSPTVHHGLNN